MVDDEELRMTERQEEADLMDKIHKYHGSMFYTSYSDYAALIRMELSGLHLRQAQRRTRVNK